MIRDQYGEGSRSWTTHIGLTSLKQWNVDLEAYRAGNPDSYESYRQSLLAQYNKIKSNKHLTSFTDWKNTPLTKARFENMIGYRNAYSRAEHYISEMKSIVDKYWN